MAKNNHHAGEEIRITNIDINLKNSLKILAKENGMVLCTFLKKHLRTISENGKMKVQNKNISIQDVDQSIISRLEQKAWKEGETVASYVKQNLHKII